MPYFHRREEGTLLEPRQEATFGGVTSRSRVSIRQGWIAEEEFVWHSGRPRQLGGGYQGGHAEAQLDPIFAYTSMKDYFKFDARFTEMTLQP